MNKGIYDIGIIVPYSLLATSQFMDLRLTDSFSFFVFLVGLLLLGRGLEAECPAPHA